MLKFPFIEGFTSISIEDVRDYYFSEIMLKENLVFYYEVYEDEGDLHSELGIYHLTENDARIYTLYEGVNLYSLQLYGMIKDMYDLYNKHTIEEFLIITDEVCLMCMFSSMQSTEEAAKNLREMVSEIFNRIKNQTTN